MTPEAPLFQITSSSCSLGLLSIPTNTKFWDSLGIFHEQLFSVGTRVHLRGLPLMGRFSEVQEELYVYNLILSKLLI